MAEELQDVLEEETPEHLLVNDEEAIRASTAISLKRIADALEKLANSAEMIL